MTQHKCLILAELYDIPKNYLMIYKSLKLCVLFLFFSLIQISPISAEADLAGGKALFKAKCATCHNKNMKDDLTGPALGGVQERWEGREEVLYAWIRNSQAVIASGDKYANDLYAQWKNSLMTPFPELTDQDIENLLGYIDGKYKGTYDAPVVQVAEGGGTTGEKKNNLPLYGLVAFVLAALAVVLARIISNLNHMIAVKSGATDVARPSLLESIGGKSFISFVLFGLVIWGGYTTVNNAIGIGRQQGYAPEQPIKFSHATHAGAQKIDCQYCHDGARRSKHSVIPAANTCMNCHKAVKKGSQYGTGEISKIYASVGYDPTSDTYIENYDQMPEDSIKSVYQEWFKAQYLKDAGLEKLDKKGEDLVEDQWSHLVSSLTGPQKKKIGGPIEWVRIHNLPDHVYFNHAQHVTVGEVNCENCHGKVEEMEVVGQYSPLSMGWCVNCHRETEVQFQDNEYYNSFKVYHEEIKKGDRTKVTVEEIGGLECQKCHY